MSKKALRISVTLHIENVTCPGVWLCPRGKVFLRLCMFDRVETTKSVTATFPLQFHERFHYQKIFSTAYSVNLLRECLSKTSIYIELVQIISPHSESVLAFFRTSVADLLYPVSDTIGKKCVSAISLLMDATDKFPGKIAPKIEVMTSFFIEEMINYPLRGESWILNPKNVESLNNVPVKPRDKGKVYQKKVCHSNRSIEPCYSCRSTERKYHVPDRSYHRRWCSNEKENKFSDNVRTLSNSTFVKCAHDARMRENACETKEKDFLAQDECNLCSEYERTLGSINKRRSRSVPRNRFHTSYYVDSSKVPNLCRRSAYRSKDDNNTFPSNHGVYQKHYTTPRNSSKYCKPNASVLNCPCKCPKFPHIFPESVSYYRDSNEKLLSSVLPDKFSASDLEAAAKKVKPPPRVINPTVQDRCPVKNSEDSIQASKNSPKIAKESKLKCCTNCYEIVCTKCKQKINLAKEVCATCQETLGV